MPYIFEHLTLAVLNFQHYYFVLKHLTVFYSYRATVLIHKHENHNQTNVLFQARTNVKFYNLTTNIPVSPSYTDGRGLTLIPAVEL